MSMMEELFSEDLIGDPETLEDERETGGEPLFLEDEANENDGDAENDYVSQTVPQSDNRVQPKKRVVKNPQPKLNAERLKGPRGLSILENVFKDYKFCGKGYEKRDLDQVMKRLEHWAHRLFPKYQFDDCLEKLETLGHKKPVQVYLKKIRMGLESAESSAIEPALEDNEDLAIPLDPFDELLSQQLSEAHDSVSSQSVSPTLNKAPSTKQPPKTTLTEEQKERMERNRQIAQERRLARLKALQESQEQKQQQQQQQQQANASSEIVDGISTENELERNVVLESEFQETPSIETVQTDVQEENMQLASERTVEVGPPADSSNTE